MSSISPSVGAGSSAQQIGRGAASSSRARGGAHGKQLNSRWNSGRKPEQKLPLTHFISIPIGHHPALHAKWTQISRLLLNASPAIPGLDDSVILKPGSLHITLGVMSLWTDKEDGQRASRKQADQANSMASSSELHSVQDAIALLNTLREPIRELVRGGISDLEEDPVLYLPLERMDIMRDGRNRVSDDGHVLWVGPNLDGKTGGKIGRVCDLIHSTFKKSGYLQDTRPLKLHCTLINTVYRKRTRNPFFTLADVMPASQSRTDDHSRRPARGRQERIPFSYSSILSSAAYRSIGVTDNGLTAIPSTSEVCKVDLGSWPVDTIEICKMGSQDAHGVYQSVGGISLR